VIPSEKILYPLAQESRENRPLYAKTLTRHGADLNFDYKTCPPHSLMTLKKRFLSRTTRCPKVFIIGAKKGGTTSLYQYMSQHPDFQGIRLHEDKWVGETFFFAQLYGHSPLKSYLKQFPTDKMSGDASVDNLVHCQAPIRIWKTCGTNDIKIIVLLRNPMERYISNFMMRIRKTAYAQYTNISSIAESIQSDVKLLNDRLVKKIPSLLPIHFNKSTDWYKLRCIFECCENMMYEGFYYVFLMNWLCNFPKENMLFLNSEEMFHNPALILKQVLDFVGLKPLNESTLNKITSETYNKGIHPFLKQHHLSSDDRRTLSYYYSTFDKAMFDILDWNNLDWY
jgi:[heparan sulfate]-glucosamine 3-sulfotransferase 2